MLFPTLTFAVFFAVVFGLNWGLAALAERHAGSENGFVSLRKLVLLAASLVFYGWWSWPFALMLLASSVINHGFALWMAGRGAQAGRLPVVLAVSLNIGVLVFFKYTGFLFNGAVAPLGVKVAGWLGRGDAWIAFLESAQPFLDMIVLPVGISFYTFQALSYVIDVSRGEVKPARRWIDFANYLAFFPQLVAGPIVRAGHLIPAMENLPGTETRLDTARAGVLILLGLIKKMVIADYLATNLADPLFAMPEEFGAIDALMGVYAYTLQIYCDFSAYSDIAIGCALLLGFEFPINFDAPYFSDSFKTFWRRWHISLSSWLRDYLYIPLGGSRRGKARTYANLMLTMFLGGLWHGAGWAFALWGILHGALLAVERMLGRIVSFRPPKWLARIFVFHVVAFLWILFRAGSAGGMETFKGVLNAFRAVGAESTLPVTAGAVVLAAGFALQLCDGARLAWLTDRVRRWPAWVQGGLAAVVFTIILGLAPEGVAPFIYFQF
ncbi:MAG: MBOAT family protein [Kiritimatiellae bacterium]|nr:MBOAT family protein [Kiritimatiellia bacterium]